MFDMVKHVVGHKRLERIPDCSCDEMRPIAVMMHGPNCKKSGEALSYGHSNDVIFKKSNVKYAKG